MATCPSGHESVSDDFCDVCGIRLGAPTLSAVEAGASSGMGSLDDTVEVAGPSCPRCGAPRDGQFCEACGWNFAEGAGPAV
ncbi:MAG: hypothetical protein J2P26_08585, partial [Nocardiopsaceae bacterium]|nr:hypothetical protein [Nocardiopsaceae bacterium]